MNRNILIIFITLVAIGIIFTYSSQNKNEKTIKINRVNQNLNYSRQLKINNTYISVEIADDITSRTRGLSGRALLSKGSGLLFIFNNPDKYAFWMKDMNFPIDIIWIDSDWKVIDITENISPETFPKLFMPSSPAQYVLETNAFFAEEKEIRVGDTAKLIRK